jgi:hypothetical protein
MNDFDKIINNPTFENFITDISQKVSSEEYIKNIGLFLATGYKKGIITPGNFIRVLDKLSQVTSISELPPEDRDNSGITQKDNNNPLKLTLKINPDMDEFHRRQYLFRELTHVVLAGENQNIISTFGKYFAFNPESPQDNQKLTCMSNGYLLLEDAMAQEVSESLVYASYNRPRPIPTKAVHEPDILPRIPFSTNWNSLGLYQPLAVAFSRTFRGIGCLQATRFQNRDEITMSALCAKAFNGNFANQLLTEYKKNGQLIKLCSTLMNLGNVYLVKQSSMGVNNGVTLNEANIQKCADSYNNLNRILFELEDQRRPMSTNIDFMNF